MEIVEKYLATRPPETHDRIRELHSLIADALPTATVAMKWNQPAFLHPDGMILTVYSCHKHHCNVVVTPSALGDLALKFGDFERGKGSVKIPHDKPIPGQLVRELVQHRLHEYERDGVKWM